MSTPIDDGSVTVAVRWDNHARALMRAGYVVRAAEDTDTETYANDLAVYGIPVVVLTDNTPAGKAWTRRVVSALRALPDTDVHVARLPRGTRTLGAWSKAAGDNYTDELRRAVTAALSADDDARKPDTAKGGTAGDAPGDELPDTHVQTARAVFAQREADGVPVRFTQELGWIGWDEYRWRTGHRAKSQLRGAVQDYALALQDAAEGMPVRSADEERARAHAIRVAKAAQNSNAISGVMREMESAPGARIDLDELDANPDVLAVRNGVIDLRTGKLRPSSPADLVTHALDIDYDPAAKCPRWERFITELWPGDAEAQEFMRRWVGYSLTGRTDEQSFVILLGAGSNGKGVLVQTLGKVLGPISRTVDTASLMAKREDAGSTPTPELAKLRRARIVNASEAADGSRLNEAMLKLVTGQDRISARFLHSNPFEFVPEFKLWLATNHLPRVAGTDNGIWRRIRVVEFPVTFVKGVNRDDRIKDELEAELPGILAWCVRAARDWYADGLPEAESITGRTSKYRQESDRFAAFVEDELVFVPGAFASAADVWERYAAHWRDVMGEDERYLPTRRKLADMLAERYGVECGRGRVAGERLRGFHGVRLRTPADRADGLGTPRGTAAELVA